LTRFLVIAGAAVAGMLMERPFLLIPGFMVLLSSYYAYDAARQAKEATSIQERPSSPGR
jgi:hypothetical protein